MTHGSAVSAYVDRIMRVFPRSRAAKKWQISTVHVDESHGTRSAIVYIDLVHRVNPDHKQRRSICSFFGRAWDLNLGTVEVHVDKWDVDPIRGELSDKDAFRRARRLYHQLPVEIWQLSKGATGYGGASW